jgi:hypothetical protein
MNAFTSNPYPKADMKIGISDLTQSLQLGDDLDKLPADLA